MVDARALFKVLFKSYYRSMDMGQVLDIAQREFGFQLFDKEGMIRHLAFKDAEELRSFLASKIPAHAYHSAALYRDPGNPNMEAKGWLGTDLVFDIDGDHLPTPSCSGVELMTLECLGDALEELGKLLDILIEELGLGRGDLGIFFSGHRGFHVHVRTPEARGLGQEERRELVDYLLAKGLDASHLVRGKVVLVDVGHRGIGGRVAAALHDIDPPLLEKLARGKVSRKWLTAKLAKLSQALSEKLAVHVDEVVTMDLHRLIRMPNSLHGKTGLRVVPLSLQDVERGPEYVLEKAVAFRKGWVKVSLTRKIPVKRVFGEEINGEAGTVAKVPIHLGIYLVSTGWATLVSED